MAIRSEQDCTVPTYQKASWKGVSFEVESSADEFGRRGDLYEYPLSEDTAWKDLGRKARKFRVEGYLIGANQVTLTQQMKRQAESKEPGTLIHPMYGSQRVACVTLTTTADYKREKRRTKLSFEFVEANASSSPFKLDTTTADQVNKDGSDAVDASKDFGGDTSRTNAGGNGAWGTDTSQTNAQALSGNLSQQISPAATEPALDVQDQLNGNSNPQQYNNLYGDTPNTGGQIAPQAINASTSLPDFFSFRDVVDPIDSGTAVIRQIHEDALVRLREFNRFAVSQPTDGSADCEALIITTRLALIRDFAVKASMTKYKTIRDALSDLDFIMSVYDDEERAALAHCADRLVSAIRKARATAAQAILSANIRLPGVVITSVDGVWPSLVAAHKIYFDGRRFEEIENYNSQMSPFFIGRSVVSPAPMESPDGQ